MPYIPSFGAHKNLRRFHEVLAKSSSEPAAGLEHPDEIALLDEPKRGDTSPESRTDDQNVIVRFHPTSMDLSPSMF